MALEEYKVTHPMLDDVVIICLKSQLEHYKNEKLYAKAEIIAVEDWDF
jgi:hypothetical protein